MCGINVDTDALVRKYETLIHGVLAKKLPAYVGDEDLIQTGRIALWRCAKRYDPDKGKFSTYAYKAIYHNMLKELSKRKTEVSLNTPVISEEECELQDLIPDLKQTVQADIRFELADFYKTLTDRQKDILKRKADGYTRKEIAHTYNVSVDLIDLEMKRIKNQWKDFHKKIEEDNNEG